MNCPCTSGKTFDQCCEPFIEGKSRPETAETLMRSRYTAFTRGEIDYIRQTLAPESREGFDGEALRASARQVKWKGLTIKSTEKGGPDDQDGIVEFSAFYRHGDEEIEHHEISKFRRGEEGQWYFVDGDIQNAAPEGPKTVTRTEPKIGRNDPCACGSGKKAKKCCGAAA